MDDLKSVKISCPYCGAKITVAIDCSVENQDYIEDCHVCCRPIDFSVNIDPSGNPKIGVSREDD